MSSTQKNITSGRNQLHNAMWEVRDILDGADLWKTPDTNSAFACSVIEMGEVFDAHLRALRPDDNRNSDREVEFEKELADLWIMLATAYGRSPQLDGYNVTVDGVINSPMIRINHQLATAYRHFSQGEDYHLFTQVAMLIIEKLCPGLRELVGDKLMRVTRRETNKKAVSYLGILTTDEHKTTLEIDEMRVIKIHDILEPFWRNKDNGKKEI